MMSFIAPNAAETKNAAPPNNANMLACALTYSGLLPLVGALLAATIQPSYMHYAAFAAATYAAVIVSFLCGIHWAVHLLVAPNIGRNLLITSNVVALHAWAALLVFPHPAAFGVLILSFIYLLLIDKKLGAAGFLPHWYTTLRVRATYAAVLLLLAISITT